MLLNTSIGRKALTVTALFTLSSCYHPPYNNFKPYNSTAKNVLNGAAVGAVVGAAAGNPLVGTAIGGTAGTVRGLYKNSKVQLLKDIQNESMQLVEYGDTMTLIVPTDKYYIFDSPHLNQFCYKGLVNIVRLLRYYPCTPVYVAGFTDNIGSRYHKTKLSQAQAETMLTFLWANNISAKRLNAEGYGETHDIGQNSIIHGSAFNRRIEIQWSKHYCAQNEIPAGITK